MRVISSSLINAHILSPFQMGNRNLHNVQLYALPKQKASTGQSSKSSVHNSSSKNSNNSMKPMRPSLSAQLAAIGVQVKLELVMHWKLPKIVKIHFVHQLGPTADIRHSLKSRTETTRNRMCW